MIKYRIPPSLLRKEVLVDTEFIEEFAGHGDVVFPHAFPGFVFRYVGGTALDAEPMRSALRQEYPHVSVPDSEPEEFPSGVNVFVEAPPERTRDVITRAVLLGFEHVFGVARESVVLSVTAEPGWKEYSALSALVQTFYEVVDAYRLPSDAFYPHPRGSMAGFFFKRVREYGDVEGYYRFLQCIFQNKRKRLSNMGFDDDRRPFELEPRELLELYETTGR
ncbi:MAG: rRNA (adenine1518-N6/adenine1519-N6)-dimethyltransferase [Candidatus Diapherotrites archaeon]|nr:rRNA (adenine1518-N6/adenine1519-N6)-dimethyltransferase [Candidatus Diapherotrites archaeon]